MSYSNVKDGSNEVFVEIFRPYKARTLTILINDFRLAFDVSTLGHIEDSFRYSVEIR